jgi:predicted small lipoprotein YifL
MAATLRILGVAMLCLFAVSACGKKGPLEAPKSADSPKVQKGQAEPHRSFVLDPLLK